MTKSEKQARYDWMVQKFNSEHLRLEQMKKDMVVLQKEITRMPTIVEERPDELSLKAK